METIKIGILTISDRANKGEYEDVSGVAAIDLLKSYLTNKWEPIYKVIPDEKEIIQDELTQMVDQKNCCLVITTGGTGPASRDVTPDVTSAVCEKMLPGFGELMRSASLRHVPTAILSRQAAGIRGKSLIINLPGKPNAIKECLEVVFPAVPDCLDLIGGPYLECDSNVIKIFRPKS